MASESIYGSRPGTERHAPKQYSLRSLMSGGEEAADLARLYEAVWDRGANCLDNPNPWTGDDLPTDREAQALCSGCAVREMCREFAEKHPQEHGVWGGYVFGREEEEENE